MFRFLAVVAVAAVALAGCTGDDDAAPDDTLISATTMRGALLQPADVGPAWSAPAEAPDPAQLGRFCAGPTTDPGIPVPPGGEVVTGALVDEGDRGAQTLYQTALVYPSASAAGAALTSLRAVADNCPPNVTVPARSTQDASEPAFTETTATVPLAEGRWSGFVITRHKKYDPGNPGLADTAIAVLAQRNVVLVDQYAIYRLGQADTRSTGPQFTADWQNLVGTVLKRVG